MFISFEGGDGAGKTTQVGLLAEWLTERGHDPLITREPGGTELGRSLRDLILHGGDMDPRTEALLYAADRAHHVDSLVRPALAAGRVVLTDRYLDSSVAYQGVGRGLGAERVEDLNRWAVGGLLPDLTLLLDLDPARLPDRLQRAFDRLERAGQEFHRATREAFLARAAAAPERFVIMDAGARPEQLADRIRAVVSARLARPGARA
ncbi:dTMP kinase [Pseudactinotalea sp. HY158]|uniref:dTMP kinase n=1 Tax=unclassified Pseudactinotalea TaxID=2649176 RepID=UPI00129C2C10|nr:dTMP kinase [Pseudactinotalea sp. HY158]MPV48929.1 dTMP kinase [Pseudactinotalea sp. HY160]QGH68387.1 dTMP kinase [Pseudactinotalea sp. HY158]